MITTNRGIWEKDYRQISPEPPSEPPRSALSAFIAQINDSLPSAQEDDFSRYINGRPTPPIEWQATNLFRWWLQSDFPSLRQWVFDTLSIPAMSAELERVFSQSKRTLTDARSRMAPATFEAT